ncbi:MAG TPA: sodium:proton antiporter [Chloroflexota bacterium]|nr:sodium:proton antiporter [Chloroflexota bacterium]
MKALEIESAVVQLAWMLLGASIVGMLAWRVRLPYAVALLLGALVLEESHVIAVPRLDPGILLFVLLPPLLFDAAFRLDDKELRTVARPVLFLALPGTVATAAIVGIVVIGLLRLPWDVALLFGTIVAATDPVAVVAVFRSLGAPARLSVIAEAESLFNDGIAITLYTVLLGLVTAGDVNVLGGVGMFARQVVGGVAIGGVLGVVCSRVSGMVDDHLIEMTLSTSLAYGSYLIAQSLDASGPLACVAAGLIHGSYGRQVGMSERSTRLLDDLWEYFGFVANAIVFLLVGFSTSLASLAAVGWAVGAGIVAVLLSRVLVVFGIPPLLPRRLVTTTGAERLVLVWGGLRGALTVTLALALPVDIPERSLLIAMAFGVVLFTMVVQGITLPILVRRAGLATSP